MTASDRPVHEQVLEADEQATPGPWDDHPRTSDDQSFVTGDGFDAEVFTHNDRSCDFTRQDADAHLIALYRTAAPVLARQVQAALALHKSVYSNRLRAQVCTVCKQRCPCPTVRALTEVGE